MVRFSKVRDVKTPTRGTSLSGGLDFYIPNFTLEEINTSGLTNFLSPNGDKAFLLNPNQGITIPTGIRINLGDYRKTFDNFDDGEDYSIILLIDNKSGIASKRNLLVGANTVDEDYQGEIHMNVINVGKEVQKLQFNEKLVQGKFELVLLPKLEEVEDSELFQEATERGQGGFGSTGLK